MSELILYYGTECPTRHRTSQLGDTTMVVLQPYHPLCLSGTFEDYFPNCRRFVYWNPTSADPDALDASGRHVPVLGHDATWNLTRLDLRRIAARRFAVQRGLEALATPGVHGLFVDDLDLWARVPDRRQARRVLRSVLDHGGGDVRWVVNRGFWFWHLLPTLEAVVLENLAPADIDRMEPAERAWVRNVALRALRRVRDRHIAVYSLTYDATVPSSETMSSTAAELSAFVRETLFGNRELDRWPAELTDAAGEPT